MSSNLTKRRNLVYSLKSNNESLIGLYIGIWCGDGTQYIDKGYRIKICCHSDNKKMIKFFKFVLAELFGKTVVQVVHEKRHRSLIRFKSKFIYNFVNNYVQFGRMKTHTVCLKDELHGFSKEFLESFILGLTLTDGYLKDKFYFNVTSNGLADNVLNILKEWGFNPSCYIHDRSKYQWKDLHMVRLNKKESIKLLNLFDSLLKKLNSKYTFNELKYEEKKEK